MTELDEWLIIETPDGDYVWNLGRPTLDEMHDLALRARVAAGMPVESSGMPDDGYCVMNTHGEPHPQRLATATVGSRDDLMRVSDAEVAEYAAERARIDGEARMEAAKIALDALTPEQRAMLAGALRAG